MMDGGGAVSKSFFRRLCTCCSSNSVASNATGETNNLPIWVGFFFIANYLLVTGFLGMPFAFFHGGMLAGVAALFLVTAIFWITAGWMLETMARAQALSEYEALSSPMSEPPHFYVSDKRKFEVAKLFKMFVGRWAEFMCIIFFVSSAFIYLLSFSTVVASTFSVNLPLNFAGMSQCNSSNYHFHVLPSHIGCRNAYRFCLFLLACVVIPLSLIGIKQQAALQVVMSILRFIIVGALLAFVIGNLIAAGDICTCTQLWRQTNNTTFLSDDDGVCNVTSTLTDMMLHFRFEAWGALFLLLVVGYTVHPALPVLTHPLRQKQHLGKLIHVAFISFGLLYLLIGVIIPLWWKDCINENCTLNWGPLIRTRFSLSLRIFSYFIILFPNVDIVTAYPISTTIIVNNVYGSVVGHDSAEASKSRCRSILLMVMKLVTALIPISVAMFVSNLVTVLKYLGLLEICSSLFFPVLLQLSSQWLCYKTFKRALDSASVLHESSALAENTNDNHKESEDRSRLIQPATVSPVKPSDLYMTPYSTIFSHWPVVVGIAVIGVVIFVISFISIVLF